MKILIFGATGRVGNSVALKALENGHSVVALVRNRNKVKIQNERLTLVEGDIYDKDILQKLGAVDFDILVNVIGADPLKPATIFSDTTRVILALLAGKPGKRYIAITGIAQMEQTFLGKISIGILKMTPVKHGIKDHQDAYEQVARSNINWTLIGCPYIKDGEEKSTFKSGPVFKGGFKTIHPADVANAIVQQFDLQNYRKIIGIWY